MLLSRLRELYNWVDQLSTHVKTMIIVFLMVLASHGYIQEYTKLILRDYTELVREEKQMAEEYTKMKTPEINSLIQSILRADHEATNVILLNYHNTLTSTHGLSYYYLTTLTEKIRGADTEYCGLMWNELNYLYYGEEIDKINNIGYLRIDSLENSSGGFPKLTILLARSNAVSAAFYPIDGAGGSTGMLVILYNKTRVYNSGYYMEVLKPYVYRLSSILDYNSNREEFRKEYKLHIEK